MKSNRLNRPSRTGRPRRARAHTTRASTLLLLWLLACAEVLAARFSDRIRFEQPDGTLLDLRGEGNEYWAVYETLEGYTVVFVPEARAYQYAALSADGETLVASGLEPGKGDPQALGLRQHLRVNASAAAEQARRANFEFEHRLAIGERWEKLKAANSRAGSAQLNMLRYGPTVGAKCGLTLLIDFDETPATLPVASVEAFLNGDDYRANGNEGSVKEYYYDVSDGRLLYTNLVVGYIRIPRSLHARAYYDDLNRACTLPVNELIRDAIQVLTNQPNYMTEIVPRLEAVSVNEAGEVLAANIFVAGRESGVWAKGLWPHMDSLVFVGPQELWPGGKRVNLYQMTTTTFNEAALQIGTFCHETGHLLCGFPDIYDYDSGSVGGAGAFCLMNSWVDLTNPQHFCAYLKYMAGWASVTEIIPGPARSFTLLASGTNGSHYLRYRPVPVGRLPGKEYYLIENRRQAGRDAQIPGAGILVWHIDELGNNNNENLLPNAVHANYEVTLVQADNRWDLQANANEGDPTDPFYARNPAPGYQNRFSDSTTPGAGWWDGTRSGLELREFSAKGVKMTLTAEIKSPSIVRDPISQWVNAGEDLFLSIQMATNQPYAFVWAKAGTPLVRSERVSGVDGPVLALRGVVPADAGPYTVVISGPAGYQETSRVAQVTVTTLRRLISTDLGDARAQPGNTAVFSGGYQVTAAGSGCAGATDGCRFLSEAVTGDCDVRLNVADLSPETGQLLLFGHLVFGQAGLMVRASLDSGSPAAAILVQPDRFRDSQVQAVARFSEYASAVQLAQGRGAQPMNNWVRLKREGDVVSLYSSLDGSKWDWLDTVRLPLGVQAFVGPVVTSYNPLVRVVANLSSYALQTNAPPSFAIASQPDSAQEGTTERARFAVTASRNGPLEVAYALRDPSRNGTAYERLSGRLNIPAGTNVAHIDIIPIDDGEAEPPTVVTVIVTASGVNQSSASAILFDDEQWGAGLKREIYSPVTGTAVADLTTHYRYPGTATLGTVGDFESPISRGSGQVLTGYLTPPVTGPYRFYLASENAAELWLSPDPSAEHAVKIAEETNSNTKRNWAGSGSTNHISAPIVLTAGNWYFIRALHKAGVGTPHLAVAWQPPGTEPPRPDSAPISRDYLTWALPVRAGGLTGPLTLVLSPTGHLLLSTPNPSPRPLVLEASSDLRAWTPIWTTNQVNNLDLSQLDPAGSTEPTRFFRLKSN